MDFQFAEYVMHVVFDGLDFDEQSPGICSHLLSAFPDIIVLCVAADLSVAFLQHRRPQRYVIPDTSPNTILTSLRSMMGNS